MKNGLEVFRTSNVVSLSLYKMVKSHGHQHTPSSSDCASSKMKEPKRGRTVISFPGQKSQKKIGLKEWSLGGSNQSGYSISLSDAKNDLSVLYEFIGSEYAVSGMGFDEWVRDHWRGWADC